MRRAVLFMHVSLDGFAAWPAEELDWITVDDKIWNDVIDLQNTADTALFGRSKYQGFESYWPSVAADSSSSENEVELARGLDDAIKVVLSKCLEKVEWQNTRIVREIIPEGIAAMRRLISRHSEEARYERRRSETRAHNCSGG